MTYQPYLADVHLLIIGGSQDDRRRATRTRVPHTLTPVVLDAGTLPFVRASVEGLGPAPRVLIIADIDRAFPDAQTAGTRLVLTQSTYLMQRWIDRLAEGDRIIATADPGALEERAPESLRARGPWSAFRIVDLDRESELGIWDSQPAHKSNPESRVPNPVAVTLARAFAASSADDRVRLCRDAVAGDPQSPIAWLALASACRETRDMAAARDAVDRAAALAPDWEAVPYESGKLWLAYDDMARARDAFARAADLMPTFSAAFSNLGATLGELDETEAALAAFHRALAHDPHNYTILNNIGVVSRELARLDESAAALRRVVELAPEFVFGHYNLGHTLFLAGKYGEALHAYEEGQRRDPEHNRRQGCRLAIMRLANGDAAGATRDLWRFANGAPPDERDELLLEAYEIAHALLTQHPELGVHRAFLDRLGAEITKSE